MGSPDADLPPESLSKQIDFILEIDRLKQALATKTARELQAAERIFGLLPSEQDKRLRALWDEFEANDTPEARFANAIDRLQPLLNNYFTGGETWREPGVNKVRVIARNEVIGHGSPRLWAYAEGLIEDAVRKGFLPPANIDR